MKISKIELEKKEIDYILSMINKGKYEIPLELILSPFNLSLDLIVTVDTDTVGKSNPDPCLDTRKHIYLVTSIDVNFCIDADPVDYIEFDTNKLISELNDKL